MTTPQKLKDVSFVLVPGSFATTKLYEDNLVAALRGDGYDARPVELLSANDGSRLPAPTMEQDAEYIRTNVLSILDDQVNPKNVLLTVHSYSGLPGSSAVKGLGKADRTAQGKSTAVIGIVYIGSFLPALGQSVRDINPEAPEPYKSGLPGEYFPLLPAEYGPFIFSDFPAEEIPKLFSHLTRHSSDSYSGKASYEAWKYIPSVQIIPGADAIVPPQLQEEMYQNAVAAGGKVKRVYVEGAGHAVNGSRTELVVDEMINLAKEASSTA